MYVPKEQIKSNEVVSEKPVKKPVLKNVTIKHHHAKPYRKRHITGLLVFVCFAAISTFLVIRYNKNLTDGLDNAKNFISKTFVQQEPLYQTIQSSQGYSLTFDAKKFYATAIDGSTGDVYIGTELSVARPYETIRIAASLDDTKSGSSNMTVHYYSNQTVLASQTLQQIEAVAIKDITNKATLQAKKTGSSNVTYGNKLFLKTDWEFQSNSKILAGVSPTFTTYTTTVADKPFVVEVINNVFSNEKSQPYDEIMQSLYFGTTKVSSTTPRTKEVANKVSRNTSLLDTLLLGNVAHAAPQSELSAAQISAQYGPAVVKLFNAYCLDIYFDGKSALTDICSASTGSGFFITPDGYIASNGHVVNADPKDLLIYSAYNFYKRGDTRLLDYLAAQAKITAADLPTGTPQQRADFLFDKFYKIDGSRFSTKNSVVNLFVGLSKDQPDVKEMLDATVKRQAYNEQSTIRKAKVIATDYRTFDGAVKFHASDVAIIKIAGSNYPVTKLGSIASLLQGANLNILGFPGNASQNGIVDAEQSSVTLTSGKVSAIKNALGSDKKLIETDTTIGHGNSGGPAFNDNGEVMGISTYIATKVGDGTYNYVRDIKDLSDLAASASIKLGATSKTQTEWEKALKQFNAAHYSKSIGLFANVKKLYPSHPKADEFIAAAQANIAAGKDVVDFPIRMVVIISVMTIAGAVACAVFIVRHKRAHNVYKAHVTGGMMDPIAKGDPSQTVAYDPAHVKAQKNVLTATRVTKNDE